MLVLSLPLVCSAALLAAASALFQRAVRRVRPQPWPHAFRVALAGLGIIFVAGIWWGVPWCGWAPDELPPWVVFDAVDKHFAGGWADKYPPVHYYLNAILYVPFLLARAVGVDPGTPAALTMLQLLSRALSVLMALGSVCGVYAVADELYGATGGLLAAILTGISLPFVYYAKVANVDVPYLFWFAWSMLFYARTIREGGTANAVLFAITAAVAVETKDQAAGFYVLPFLHALIVRRRPALIAIGAGLLTFVVVSNIVFNPSGFAAHLRLLADVGTDLRFEVPGARLARQWAIWRVSAVSTVFSMTWPAVLVAIAGLASEVWRRRYWWLLLPIVSYYLFFLSTITSVFDRYLMGDFMILAIAAGGWLGETIDARPLHRRALVAATAIVFAAMTWYGASMDILLIKDTRYSAARWLHDHVPPGGRVALLGPRAYLPIVEPARFMRDLPPAADAPGLPDFVVVNTQLMRRRSMWAPDRAWWTWLSTGGAPYRPVRTFTTRPALSLLSYFSTFTNDVEDEYTNLDKAAPPIVIYQRVGR